MTTPEQQPDADKPSLHLIGQPFTAANMAAFFRKLTGNEPTAEELADLPAWCERINAKIAAKRAADENKGEG